MTEGKTAAMLEGEMMSHSRQKYFSADQEVLFLEITK
jgi:hypothetical protein